LADETELESYLFSYSSIVDSSYVSSTGAFTKETFAINKSEIDGEYSIDVTYATPLSTGITYLVESTYGVSPNENGLFTISADYGVVGLGITPTGRLANAYTRFSGETDYWTTATIVSSIFEEAKYNIPYNVDVSSLSYYVESLNSNVDPNAGRLSYSVVYKVTDAAVSSLLDNCNLGASVSLDNNNGDFQINVNGSFGHYHQDNWIGVSIPSVSSIMEYLADKSIVPSGWATQCKVITNTHDYSQGQNLENWSMSIAGNVFSSGENMPVWVNKEINHAFSYAQYKETISETCTISLATSLFSAFTYLGAGYSSIWDTLSEVKDSYVHGSSTTYPTSIIFPSCDRAPALISVGVNTLRLKNDQVISYTINREFALYAWSLGGLDDTIPIEDMSIDMTRNFDILQARNYLIPGRRYGAVYQNLKTYSNPTVSIGIKMTPGRTWKNVSSPSEYVWTIDDILVSANCGTDVYHTGYVFQEMSDNILRTMLGLTGLVIDRNSPTTFNIAGECALVTEENDDYGITSNSYGYNVTYTLINMGWRAQEVEP
jgi:hypothetical protein